MKVLVEVRLKKVSGATCDESEIVDAIEDELDGSTFYPISIDANEESEYEVTRVRLFSAETLTDTEPDEDDAT